LSATHAHLAGWRRNGMMYIFFHWFMQSWYWELFI